MVIGQLFQKKTFVKYKKNLKFTNLLVKVKERIVTYLTAKFEIALVKSYL